MTNHFGKTLHRLRTEKGLSQQQLADLLCVTRSAVANWETGSRLPDTSTIVYIAQALDVDTSVLIAASIDSLETPIVVLVDDNSIALEGGLSILQEALPQAHIVGFLKPTKAIEFFEKNYVALAFLDIELGKTSGLDLCQELLQIRPMANIVYLTAYPYYSLDAWNTDACGFLLKPLDAEEVRKLIPKLRHPVRGLS